MSTELVSRDYSEYVEYITGKLEFSTSFRDLVSIYLQKNKELFDEIYKLSEISTDVDTAYGRQLDILGHSTGVYREGRSDADYRLWIKIIRSINNSSGTSNDITRVAKFITDASKGLIYDYPYNTSVVVVYNGVKTDKSLARFVDIAAPTGTRISSVIKYQDTNLMPTTASIVKSNTLFSSNAGSRYMIAGSVYAQSTRGVLNLDVPVIESARLATISDQEFTQSKGSGASYMQAGNTQAQASNGKKATEKGALPSASVLSFLRG